MRGQWCYWKNYFSAEFCEDVIKKAQETLPVQPATVYGSSKDPILRESSRRSMVRWINRTPEWSDLYDQITKITKQSNDEWFGLDYTDLKTIQFTEYDAVYQGEFKLHQDTNWVNIEPIQRKLTFVVQLSDPDAYQGGDLTFQYLSEYPPATEIRSRGTVIFFPSLFFHQLNPVTSGIRYSLVGWWTGPNWK